MFSVAATRQSLNSFVLYNSTAKLVVSFNDHQRARRTSLRGRQGGRSRHETDSQEIQRTSLMSLGSTKHFRRCSDTFVFIPRLEQ